MTPTPPAAPSPTRHRLSVKQLAVRWGVGVDTARNRTRSHGFPLPLELGPRTLRWLEEEVEQWETSPQSRARRVVTGTRPQHRLPVGAPRQGRPAIVKVFRSPAA